jgi:hypothetical protein
MKNVLTKTDYWEIEKKIRTILKHAKYIRVKYPKFTIHIDEIEKATNPSPTQINCIVISFDGRHNARGLIIRKLDTHIEQPAVYHNTNRRKTGVDRMYRHITMKQFIDNIFKLFNRNKDKLNIELDQINIQLL